MKIHFDNVALGSRSGPNTFASRLTRALMKAGHQVTYDEIGADVSLVFIEPSGRPLAPKVVQRLDGIWFKPDEYEAKNRAIKALYNKADAIVFQSQFDRGMVEKWWGTNEERQRSYNVIGNGIDLARVSQITIPELAKIRATYDRVFVCSSNWHPQKRLKDNLRLFEHVRKTQYPNSCLFVLGANPDAMTTDPHVFYAGSQPPEVYLQIFAVADWMFHLAWADHSPNVVIEALSQGTPVVCGEVGGTKELIGHGAYGMVLKEDPYDYELTDYDHPPDIDVTQITFLPTRQELDYSAVPNIDIGYVADKYVKLFESLIK